jgi:DNA-binding transcriptional LysR family regulator
MDTRFLESFVSVADNGSIAAAARQLNLTPAAVAQRIRALEGDLGAPLLSRSGRTVRPTEAGERILVQARDLLAAARDLAALATNDRAAGEIRLGAVVTAMTGIVPDILARLSRTHPGLRVQVHPDASNDLFKKVVSGDLDAAILVEPEYALPKSCEWRVLREEPMVVITPAGMPGRDPHAILRREPFIRMGRETRGGRIVDGYLRANRIEVETRIELTSFASIAMLVDRGVGVSLVPDWSPPWPEGLRLRKLALPGKTATRVIGLIWQRATPRAGPVRALLEAATRAPRASSPAAR